MNLIGKDMLFRNQRCLLAKQPACDMAMQSLKGEAYVRGHNFHKSGANPNHIAMWATFYPVSIQWRS